MTNHLLFTAVIILICIVFNNLSNKLGIPTLLMFIALGMLFGSDGLFKIAFDDFSFAEEICSTALIFIMFYGGFSTNWNAAKKVAGQAVLLSSFGVVLTAAFVGLFCHFILGFSLYEGLLVGAVIGSTDAASVFSILRSKRLNLKYNTASLLEVESGSNDPFSYMLTIILLSIGGNSAAGIAWLLFTQIVYAIIIAGVLSVLSVWVLKKFPFSAAGFDTIFVFAVAILSYALPSVVGGNGYLSTYIVGIFLGQQSIKNKKALVHFFDGVTGLMQMFIFFLLGLLSFPSQLPYIALPALAIALFITFAARPLAVSLLMVPFRAPLSQIMLVSWSGLRGVASIVFAILVTTSPAYMRNDIFHIVFFIVLFSIAIQGSLIPMVAKKLHIIDQNEDVLKTFSDYSAEVPVQFIKIAITEHHPWANHLVRNIVLPPSTLLVLLLRNETRLVPKGNTMILSGDMLVLSALAFGDDNIHLTEIAIDSGSAWIGKPVFELPLEENKLIIMIKRNQKIIIPKGRSIIQENDILVIHQQ